MDIMVASSLNETWRNTQKCSIESDPRIKSESIENDKIFDMELKKLIKVHKNGFQPTDRVTKEEITATKK